MCPREEVHQWEIFLEKDNAPYPNGENIDVSDCLNLMNEAADGLKQAIEGKIPERDAVKLWDEYVELLKKTQK